MRIDADDVRRIAALARLRLGDDESERLRGELETILDHVARLAQADVTGIEPSSHACGSRQPLRDDEVREPRGAARALANAPDAARGHFRVPRTLPG